MRLCFKFISLLCLGFLISSCNRPQAEDDERSVISIQAPQSKIGSLSVIPSTRKACFGVNISAADIEAPKKKECSPGLSLFAGFVEAGANLELEVPRGSGRKIDLYLYLQKSGENNPCPQMSTYFSQSDLGQLYFLGSTENISLTKSVETVTITANFPGESQNLFQQLSLPASCVTSTSPSSNNSGARIFVGSGVSVGSGMKLYGRVGSTYHVQELTGSGIKLKAH